MHQRQPRITLAFNSLGIHAILFNAFGIAALALACVWAPVAEAQQATSTRPIEGLRSADAAPILLSGGEVVSAPHVEPQRADVLIEGTTIVAVGVDLAVPAGTQRVDLSGKRIYPGLIDALHEVEMPDKPDPESTGYWNVNVTPDQRAVAVLDEQVTDEKKLRTQGITTQLFVPQRGIIKGTSCVVLLLDPKHPQRLLRDDVFQHATLTVPRRNDRKTYPTSPMGATALVRQSLYDALWYRKAVRHHELHRTVSRPQPNSALQTLADDLEHRRWVFDAANERMAIRVADIADEFSLATVIRGSGQEYRAIGELAARPQTVLLPVNFPAPPSTATASRIRQTPLETWMHWYFAPENPQRLHDAGIEFCLTTDGLDDPTTFLTQVRQAVQRGLEPKVALAAMTTVPAKLLGVEHATGRVQAGMLANLAITDGDLFAKSTHVVETWIAGERFQNDDDPAKFEHDPLVGTWRIRLATKPQPLDATIEFTEQDKSLVGQLRLLDTKQPRPAQAAAKQKSVPPATDSNHAAETPQVELKSLIRQRDRLTAMVELGGLSDAFPAGSSHLTILTMAGGDETKLNAQVDTKPVMIANLLTPDGQSTSTTLRRQKAKRDSNTATGDKSAINKPATDKSTTDKSATGVEVQRSGLAVPAIEVVYPLGAYGVSQPPEQPQVVLFRSATVWTCGAAGTLEHADVLVRGGKIAEVGVGLEAPPTALVIDADGKHITPGLVDCHSHAATDGGVNEAGQVVTAEVRIGDFIDNTDINIFRQLAGGVTTVNVLHGSANPIGGQSQVLKYRWGESMQAMKFAEAPAGIKFALGENVKRLPDRYPNTRMGVEQLLRDQFLAARQYDADWRAWRAGKRDRLPPRRDLQLEALVEIQQGQRWVHCHSYRQDEIVATLDVMEEFNVRVATLQHILEGYKVADRIAAHGAGASSFADWWAYKFEVYDAIPYNGVLLHDSGVVVSFNSDDPELARHLNTEAAKATKYGAVPEIEALKFVTLNPAKQLRVDDRIGSIEVGKDADLVVWSGRPLSTTSRCEQTWIDGRKYFSLELEQQLRERDAAFKSRLVQLAIEQSSSQNKQQDDEPQDDEPEEADRWVRFDEFCTASQNRGGNQ